MRTLLLSFFLAIGVMWAQPPAVYQIFNNYSLIPDGLRFYDGIAQGSIFIVKGERLANVETPLQNVPLRTALEGVRIHIDQGTVTTYAYLYYVLPRQLAAILPSSTPVGIGQLVVENNGQTSAPVDINVVRSSFGTLTLSGDGRGAAAVHDSNYNLLSPTNTTNPGKIIVFYGSGLGGVAGDESVLQI